HRYLPSFPTRRSSDLREFLDHPQVRLLKPLDYPDLLAVLGAAYFIMTASGGIQEESPTYQKPVLILLDVTERPEVVEAGCGILRSDEHTSELESRENL